MSCEELEPVDALKTESIKRGFLYCLQLIMLLQLSVAYVLQSLPFLKERKEEGRRSTNLPHDKVWRCGVTLNQQLMSETSKPRTRASNDPSSLAQTRTAATVEETKD